MPETHGKVIVAVLNGWSIDTPTFASDANSGAFADAARGSRL